jgi:hypothetical protein
MVLEKALRDCICNTVTMFEATFAQYLIKSIYKTFVSNCDVREKEGLGIHALKEN